MSWGYETRRGEDAPNAKLTRAEAEEIRNRYERDHPPMRALAKEYEVSETVIRRVIKKDSYGT